MTPPRSRKRRRSDHWDRYPTLAALVRGECCNYDAPRAQCRMTDRPCDILAPGQKPLRWPGLLRPHPYAPPPPEISGEGDCTYFRKALLPALPPHLREQYDRLRKDKGEQDARERHPQRPGPNETFGISQATINAWCDDGLDYIRIGRERCFFVDELLAFLSEHRRGRARPQQPAANAGRETK